MKYISELVRAFQHYLNNSSKNWLFNLLRRCTLQDVGRSALAIRRDLDI